MTDQTSTIGSRMLGATAFHPDLLRKVFGAQLLLISLYMIFAKH